MKYLLLKPSKIKCLSFQENIEAGVWWTFLLSEQNHILKSPLILQWLNKIQFVMNTFLRVVDCDPKERKVYFLHILEVCSSISTEHTALFSLGLDSSPQWWPVACCWLSFTQWEWTIEPGPHLSSLYFRGPVVHTWLRESLLIEFSFWKVEWSRTLPISTVSRRICKLLESWKLDW